MRYRGRTTIEVEGEAVSENEVEAVLRSLRAALVRSSAEFPEVREFLIDIAAYNTLVVSYWLEGNGDSELDEIADRFVDRGLAQLAAPDSEELVVLESALVPQLLV